MSDARRFSYSRRHGGYYVDNVRHANGAVGCVARTDGRRWAIACDPRPFDEQRTYASRNEAAGAEVQLIAADQCHKLAAVLEQIAEGEGLLTASEVAGMLEKTAVQLEATA